MYKLSQCLKDSRGAGSARGVRFRTDGKVRSWCYVHVFLMRTRMFNEGRGVRYVSDVSACTYMCERAYLVLLSFGYVCMYVCMRMRARCGMCVCTYVCACMLGVVYFGCAYACACMPCAAFDIS